MTIPLSPTTAIHASLLSNIEGHGFKKEINEKESVAKAKSIVEKSQKKHEEAIKILEQESNQFNHRFIELGNLKTKIFNHKVKILVNEVKKRKADASHLKNPSNFTEKSTDTQIKKIQLHSLEAKINLKMNGGIVGLKGSVSGSAIIVKKMAVDAQAEKALVKAEEYKAEVEKKILEINNMRTFLKNLQNSALEISQALKEVLPFFDKALEHLTDNQDSFQYLLHIGEQLQALLELPTLGSNYMPQSEHTNLQDSIYLTTPLEQAVWFNDMKQLLITQNQWQA